MYGLPITQAQAEMLDLLRRGYRCRVASQKLGISISAGEDRIKRAKRLMECDSIPQVVAEFAVARALGKTPIAET